MPIRAVLADDHVLVRQSLKSFLEREDIQVAGEASDGQELLGVVARLCPDVAVVDISMPLMNGIEAAGEMRRASPKTRTILLTRHDEDQYVTEALRLGARDTFSRTRQPRTSFTPFIKYAVAASI